MVGDVFGILLVALLFYRLPYIWRVGEVWPNGPTTWWPWRRRSWLAYSRAAPSLIVWMAAAVASNIISGSGTLLLLGGLLLVPVLSTAFLNRPRFLVPPNRRADPGYFGWPSGSAEGVATER